jgi:hypothetical protein
LLLLRQLAHWSEKVCDRPLLDHFEQRKSDHLKEQCIALGGTFNPGKPPTCSKRRLTAAD